MPVASPQLAPSRSTARMMADVTVKFPGGKSATVPEGSPLSLAAYQVRAIAAGRSSEGERIELLRGRSCDSLAGWSAGHVPVQGRHLRLVRGEEAAVWEQRHCECEAWLGNALVTV
eukprot:scaffold262556_cov32-Tisochrysis_lutea.AAC.1